MSREIGAITDLATAYGRGVLRGISEQARAAGDWGVTHILAKTIDWTGSLDEQLPGLAGAIIQSPIGGPPLDSLRTLRLPAVSVADHAEKYGMPTVRPDHVAIGAMGAEFFLQRGFRNLGYIGRARETYACLRHEGFVNAARAAGIESLEFWVLRDRGEDWGAGVANWISALAKPVGVLVCDDSLARLVGHFATMRSIAIPEQVALLGVDDDEEACEMDVPYLSSIMTDSPRIGRAAMRMLTGMLTIGKRPTKAVLVPPVAVTERQSTDTVPTTDGLVQEAVRLMRERCASLESPVALAQALGVSAEELDERVTRALRRGVAAELRRVRVERAKHLLRVTDLSLGKLARECGFSSAASFARDFRQEAGLSPSVYRVKAREQKQAQQNPA